MVQLGALWCRNTPCENAWNFISVALKSNDKHKSSESSVEFSRIFILLSCKVSFPRQHKLCVAGKSNWIPNNCGLSIPWLNCWPCSGQTIHSTTICEMWNNNRAILDLIEISRFSICLSRLYYYCTMNHTSDNSIKQSIALYTLLADRVNLRLTLPIHSFIHYIDTFHSNGCFGSLSLSSNHFSGILVPFHFIGYYNS